MGQGPRLGRRRSSGPQFFRLSDGELYSIPEPLGSMILILGESLKSERLRAWHRGL